MDQDFTSDAVLISTTTGDAGQIVIDGTDSSGTDANDNIVLEEDNSTTVALESEKIAKLNQAEKISHYTDCLNQLLKHY